MCEDKVTLTGWQKSHDNSEKHDQAEHVMKKIIGSEARTKGGYF